MNTFLDYKHDKCFFLLNKIYLSMRMYLKNNSHKKKYKRKIIIIVLIIIIIYVFFYLQKNLNYYYLNYSENEASRIITNAISEATDDEILSRIKNKDLYKVIKNKKGEIEVIEYNSYLVNMFLRDITNNLTKSLSFEENKTNKTAFYIPMGSIFQSPLLNSKGPKIPVRMELVGSIITGINSKVVNYGINNSLIETYVHIEIKERVILPITAKDISIKNDIPISYRIIKGQIPTYYSNNNSSFMMPIE